MAATPCKRAQDKKINEKEERQQLHVVRADLLRTIMSNRKFLLLPNVYHYYLVRGTKRTESSWTRGSEKQADTTRYPPPV